MKTTRLIAGVTSAGLLGLTPVALAAAPAHAAVTYTTVATIEAEPKIEYGDEYFSIDGAVTATDPATGAPKSVYYGTATLMVSTAKNPTWTAVATDDSPSSLYFTDVKPDSNAQYKVAYSGGSNTSGTEAYTPSESAVAAVTVQRKMVVKDKDGVRVTLTVKVKPDFGKKKLTVKIAKRGKFKVKTDKSGKVIFKLPRLKYGTKVTLIAPGDKNFAKSSFKGRIT